ncbi:Os03g0309100 [Oryza sativa Japonica Group]|uniref:Os03g0309100 protein n=1 Tax=Oryza sativa subsp. japonica TaxID=39947 RepID=A0A0P0VWK2_ORYSJ|nr:Os03g0309100 [Oryza sativa Japonica Group]
MLVLCTITVLSPCTVARRCRGISLPVGIALRITTAAVGGEGTREDQAAGGAVHDATRLERGRKRLARNRQQRTPATAAATAGRPGRYASHMGRGAAIGPAPVAARGGRAAKAPPRPGTTRKSRLRADPVVACAVAGFAAPKDGGMRSRSAPVAIVLRCVPAPRRAHEAFPKA